MTDTLLARRAAAPCLLLLSLALSACSSGGQDGALPPDSEPKNLACTEHAPPGTTATPVREGLLCTLLSGLVCSVNDAARAVDDDVDTAAQVVYRVGLLDFLLGGAAGIRATLPGPVPAGRLAAFDLDLGAGVLDVALGRNVTLSTWRNGEKQEERGTGTLIALDLLGLALPQQAVVDEDAGQLVADRLVDEDGGDGAVHAAREAADHLAVPDLLADAADRLDVTEMAGEGVARIGGHGHDRAFPQLAGDEVDETFLRIDRMNGEDLRHNQTL